MRMKAMTASLTVAVAMIATPALASNSHAHLNSNSAKGHLSSPGTLCKGQSHKKTNHGKGKSAFSACVVGATRAQKELRQSATTRTAPTKLCSDQSHKKAATDTKSPFAACVSGAAKAQHEGS